ncbi:MAG: hypothetical protein R3C30_10425 [Hyphomonadaceae bacterium]
MAEPLNATFFALKKREQSGVLFRLAIAFLIAAIVLVGAFVALFWTSLAPVITWYGQVIEAASTNDTSAIEAAGIPPGFFGFIGGTLLWMFPFYILCAAFEAGALRWMIHGETVGFMGLSLGAPTWRVWSVYWIWFLLNIAFSIMMAVLMSVVVGMLAVGSGGDPAAAMTAIPFVYVVQYGLMIYFGVRFAPAAATSVARRRFAFFDAWTVTKGRFLALFGSFFLLYLIYGLVTIGLGIAYFVGVLGPSAPDLAAAANDPARFNQVVLEVVQSYITSLTNPQSWVIIGALQLVGTIFAVVFYVVMFGVNARAAQAALEEGKIKPAEA